MKQEKYRKYKIRSTLDCSLIELVNVSFGRNFCYVGFELFVEP